MNKKACTRPLFFLHNNGITLYIRVSQMPASTRRQNNVVTTSFQRYNVHTTSKQRHVPAGIVETTQ